jgi:hypothetical protein
MAQGPFAHTQNKPNSLRRAASPSRQRILDSESQPANAGAPDRQCTTSRRETKRETAAKWLDNQAANWVLTRKPQHLESTVLRQLPTLPIRKRADWGGCYGTDHATRAAVRKGIVCAGFGRVAGPCRIGQWTVNNFSVRCIVSQASESGPGTRKIIQGASGVQGVSRQRPFPRS